MAIFSRMGTVLKSNVNDVISSAEDPEKMLNQMLLDMQQQLSSAKKDVAVAIADERRLRKQYEKEKNLSLEWEKKAMLAIKAGNDELAKKALSRKTEHSKIALGFEQQWKGQKTAVDQLKDALNGLSDKIQDAKRKKNLLIARQKRAKAQQSIAKTLDGISSENAFSTLSRMEEKIDRMEAEAAATFELAQSADGDALEKEFDALENLEQDDALAALKAKMGVATTVVEESVSVSEEQQQLKEIEKELEVEISS